MHPCAYFLCRLSPAERNYDVGNRERQAIKLALEEWHQWLEGAEQPFVVRMDYNLSIHPNCKAALFFEHFQFTIFLLPWQNVNPDTFSRQFETEEENREPENIVPPYCELGALTWSY